MRIIKRGLVLDKLEYYKKHLAIVSCLLPTHLTVKEIEVLASFLALDENLTKDNLFNTEARKRVMKSLDLVPGGLSNHLGSMIKKKVLERNENVISIKDYLLPKKDIQGYQIKLVNIDETRK